MYEDVLERVQCTKTVFISTFFVIFLWFFHHSNDNSIKIPKICIRQKLVHFSLSYETLNTDGGFFLHSTPLTPSPQLIQPQWLSLSFSLTHRAGKCLPLLASKGNRGRPNHMTAKQMRFSSLLMFHAYMQSHLFSISNLVLSVPSTEILEWITYLYTSKHFT